MSKPQRSPSPRLLGLVTCLGALTTGCAGEGTLEVYVYGEEFIEEGIPAEEMSDGWAISFERFVVEVGEVSVDGFDVPDAGPFDLTEASEGQGQLYGSVSVPAESLGDGAYEIRSVDVAGTATMGGTTKHFAWVIDEPTHYEHCETTTKVPEDGRAEFEITVHADHFFYDSLVSSDPQLVFQGLADADTDADGEITKAELEAAGIGALDPGSENDVDNLWAWLVAQSRTLGHVDGEGHCETHDHEH